MRQALFSFTFAVALAVAVGGEQPAQGSSSRSPSWQVFAVRVPVLFAVDAHSFSNVWAVGDGIVHWDGRTLHTTATPWANVRLAGVSALTSNDVWVVGNVTSRAHEIPLSAHWDGRSWRRVALPAVADGSVWLADVAASAPDDVWAVGGQGWPTRPLLMHWDGSRWHRINLQRIAPALGQLNAIDAHTPDDVWAAGMEGDWRQESYGYTDYVLHWDGHRWRRVETPLEGQEGSGPYAQAIDVGLTRDVWTLDFDLSGNGPFFVRWSGPKRTAHASDWMTYENYEGIAAVSQTDVWIVGRRDFADVGKAADTPLVAHWDGKHWHVQHTSFEGYAHVGLNDVSAVAADNIWAVGNHLIVRYAR